MRCKNCGWPNRPGESIYVKCGSPLDAEPQENFETTNNAANSQSNYANSDGEGLKKTVMENNVFGPSVEEPVEQPVQEVPTVSETVCPKCGYPMRSDAVKCPNCNYSSASSVVQPSSTNRPANSGIPRRPTRMAEEPVAEEKPVLKPTRTVADKGEFKGTVNPYMMNYQEEPAFVLEPIQRMNERKSVEPVEYEGCEVVLNRDNTEPGNPTISSKEQSVIVNTDGRWYIEDLSDQKTTFVQAGHKIELHDGDIILLGNRLFKFTEQ